ncbi:ATP-binding cassette domain-containing protein [Staphylococcus agnetis]|uniref:HycC n=4 Tax=Staphylococcus TaxID=1279 RepID=A0A221C8R9_STAHY|nr:ABC transporter ATP-binding protein [Staphylococcus agnetis]ASL69765.1 HycC [Staphylococcus hyicus]MBY7664372.1 ABC transporter ATP-binding protein [Staphylococcus agnetis]MCO4325722.1 ABC transporter ATP-binding protein [Staphylococcus agnetis]MCO4356557.1 ABC transporter ATP-binding protein [Staphylococcus agnetis]MCO4362764.1 ABC transporter ATP-binding protein [Staphylococcus agnetis]
MIKISDLYVWYDKEFILENINLQLSSGEIYALIGKNGSGKTTLINTICGVLSSFKGSIVMGNTSFSAESHSKTIQSSKKERYYIADNPERIKYMNCLQYINLILDVYNTKKDHKLLQYYMERYQFSNHKNKIINDLSLGNLKKLNIICSYLINTRILIFDEPLNGLDIQAIERFIEDIQLLKNKGYLIILSTHILDVIERFTNKIVLINNRKATELTFENASQIREVLGVNETT